MTPADAVMKPPKFTATRMIAFVLTYGASIFAWAFLFPFLIGWGIPMFFTLPFFFGWLVLFYCAIICLSFGLGVSRKTNMVPVGIVAFPLAVLSGYCGYELTRHFWHYPEFWKTVLSG